VTPRGIAASIHKAGLDGRVRVTRRPGDVEIVAAGGRGGHSAVIRPWSLSSEAVIEPVRRPDGARFAASQSSARSVNIGGPWSPSAPSVCASASAPGAPRR